MAIAGSACLRASTSSRRVLLAEDQGPAWDTCDNGTGVTCVFPRMKRTLERITVSCLHSPVSFTTQAGSARSRISAERGRMHAGRFPRVSPPPFRLSLALFVLIL